MSQGLYVYLATFCVALVPSVFKQYFVLRDHHSAARSGMAWSMRTMGVAWAQNPATSRYRTFIANGVGLCHDMRSGADDGLLRLSTSCQYLLPISSTLLAIWLWCWHDDCATTVLVVCTHVNICAHCRRPRYGCDQPLVAREHCNDLRPVGWRIKVVNDLKIFAHTNVWPKVRSPSRFLHGREEVPN